MRDVIHCLWGTDFCPSHPFRGDNLGTKLRKKYENRQKVWRKKENTNSHKVIDFSYFTDLYFLFLCFSLYYLPMQKCSNMFPSVSSVVILPPVMSARSSRQRRRSSARRSELMPEDMPSSTRRMSDWARTRAS